MNGRVYTSEEPYIATARPHQVIVARVGHIGMIYLVDSDSVFSVIVQFF